MAPTGAVLVTVGIKAVVLTHGRKLGIHDIIRVDTDIYQRLANGSGKIEHARGIRIDARELGGKAIHEFLGYLIFVTQDMGADIGGNVARIATGSIAKRNALTCSTSARGVHVDHALIARAPKAQRDIVQILNERKIWDRLMTDTGMYTFMSSCQRDEWNSQLMSDTCPEITLDNVLATFRHLNASKMQTFEQGLIDVYRKLSWDYRTNNPCRLGKKIIIENLLYRWSNGRVTLDCSRREALDDLVRPFYLLEGRNVPDFRNSIGAQYGEFLRNGDNVGKLLEGEYFTVRGYQKGTVHIVFKRSDLVEKLNDIIARHYPGALPPRV